MSLELQGMGVSRGIAIGHAHILFRDHPETSEYAILPAHINKEIKRLKTATKQARKQLKAILKQIPGDAPTDVAAFIDTHLLMLKDSTLTTKPSEMIRSRGCNAEWALQLQRDSLISVFDEMEDPYLRSRKDDINHVVDRVLRILGDNVDNTDAANIGNLAGKIIVADDLSPADTVLMQHQGIAGFVIEHGGATSHTTILARSLGIPAIVSLPSARRYIQDNEPIIMDGDSGTLIAGATTETTASYQRQQVAFQQHIAALSRYKGTPAKTIDGHTITLLANAELPDDVTAISEVGADGIGLYRTEFLFMNRTTPPEEEEQLKAYRHVIESMQGGAVTIRTLDLGADKTVDGGRGNLDVTNPALGLRAIRLCLAQPQMFRTQLRAILRASAYGKTKIMFPMIGNLQELAQSRQLLERCKKELDQAGIDYDREIKVGIMIEIPAAAICADVFAQQVDFLSIGTNDLIQYTLAADRVDDHVNYLYDPLHPAVLQLIQITLHAGERHQTPVSLCGEMASAPRYTRLLLAMGLKQFSMHPNALLEIKEIIHETNLTELPHDVLAELLENEYSAELGLRSLSTTLRAT